MIERFMSFLAQLFRWVDQQGPVDTPLVAPVVPQEPSLPVTPTPMPTRPSVTELYDDWNTQAHAYHNVRVLCDRAGLSLEKKNVLCACLWQESTLKNSAINKNRNASGAVLSTDWGLAQVNDHYHIGTGKDFPSVAYVLGNPEAVVNWMIGIYKKTGSLQPWVSFTSGAYLHWLAPGSPLWKLKVE